MGSWRRCLSYRHLEIVRLWHSPLVDLRQPTRSQEQPTAPHRATDTPHATTLQTLPTIRDIIEPHLTTTGLRITTTTTAVDQVFPSASALAPARMAIPDIQAGVTMDEDSDTDRVTVWDLVEVSEGLGSALAASESDSEQTGDSVRGM